MGILGLSKLVADLAPNAIKESEMKNYFGRKIAIDASMCLYQFLIAVRSEGVQLTSTDGKRKKALMYGLDLTHKEYFNIVLWCKHNENELFRDVIPHLGETTSHLMGIFYRTIRMIENGIKPVYVFDGKPPQMKSGELNKRAERRAEAQVALEKATEAGEQADIDKFNRRLVKVTQQHSQDVKDLLKLMGVPFVNAPCEAEAQCAALVRAGKVYATATEDMDALTFGTNVLLRHMTFSEARKMPIQEFHLDKVLSGLNLQHREFVDLCILLGCDYTDSIRGVGPKRAIDLITQYKCIEDVTKNIDMTKYPPPDNWNYEGARQLFIEPEITDPKDIELKWTDPDEEGLVRYLCGDRQFNENRVRNGTKKLMKSRTGTTQGRLDTFFTVLSSNITTSKRKPELKKTTPNKRGKATPGAKGRGRPK